MSVCAELGRRITPFLDGELPDAEAAAVASHLEACPACRAQRDRIVTARRLLFEVPAPAPDPRAWQRLRREIRPQHVARASRALHRTAWAPVPLWATGSIAAGVLGLAVFIAGSNPPPRHTHPPVAPTSTPETGGLTDRTPAVPSQPETPVTRRPGIGLESTASEPAGPSPATTARPPSAPPTVEHPAGPAVEAGGAGSGPEGPPAPAGTTPGAASQPPVAPPGPAIPAGGPNVPARVPLTSVQLSPKRRPARLPGDPTFLEPAQSFTVADGIPLPRGEAKTNIQVYPQKNGDIVLDRSGKGDALRISRRNAERDGVSRNIRIERFPGRFEWLSVTFLKRGEQWMIRNDTARYGKWMGETIAIIDGDHNGDYGDYGKDAVYFTKRGHVVPLSDVLMTSQGLLEFKVDQAGGRFATRPYTGPTGLVAIDNGYNGGGQLTSVVIADGSTCFDLAGRKGPVVVPAGAYTLVNGTFQSKRVRMRILTGTHGVIDIPAGAAAPATVALGGRCDLNFRLDGDPEDGHLSVSTTSIGVVGEHGEVYEPVGRGLQRVKFALRRKSDGRLIYEQNSSVTRCPKNGHERFAAKLPNRVAAEDVKVQMFAPDYEAMFGSVGSAWAGTK